MSAYHLTPETIGGLIDGELNPAEVVAVQAHLNECHACALHVLLAQRLKYVTGQAAQSFAPSPETLARLEASVKKGAGKQVNAAPRRTVGWRLAGWGTVAAALLILVFVVGWRQLRRSDALSAELLDQHLAVLSDASSPQVLSSDRHTVKPWFQGKLPFSFNLPDQSALPPDSALLGADLVYIQGRPAALLLFTIHKHRVSVFVAQQGALPVLLLNSARSGFQMTHATAAGLDFIAVSDVNRAELEGLMAVLTKAQ
jgi:anti-sigma factor RsiW